MTNYDQINKLKTSKKLKSLAAAALVLGLAVAGVQGAYAAEINSNGTSPMSKVVAAIASKFNLNVSDVQGVVDGVMASNKAEMEAKMQTAAADKLKAAVAAGTLTQAQADLITAKAAEIRAAMQSQREADKNLTSEQRKTKMDAQKSALETWATANGIPKEDLKYLGGFGGGMGAGMMGKAGMKGRPAGHGHGAHASTTPSGK